MEVIIKVIEDLMIVTEDMMMKGKDIMRGDDMRVMMEGELILTDIMTGLMEDRKIMIEEDIIMITEV